MPGKAMKTGEFLRNGFSMRLNDFDNELLEAAVACWRRREQAPWLTAKDVILASLRRLLDEDRGAR